MKKVNHYNGITREEILEVLELRDGKFYWKTALSNRVKIGQEAGGVSKGYKRITLKGKLIPTSQMAFLCYHGWLPKDHTKYHIDHKDRDKLNNREDNLRCATLGQNNMNKESKKGSTSKYLGVYWQESAKKWRAKIQIKKRQIHLGYFYIEEEAGKAYDEAAIKHFGEFANLNFKRAV